VNRSACRWLLAFALAGGLAAPARASGKAWGVHDEAKLFRPETVARADARIEEMRRLYHRDLLVETVPAAPDADRERLRHLPAPEAVKFFDQWARERAKAAGVDGVAVLVCVDPPHVRVTAWPESADEVFPEDRRERLRKLLAQRLRVGQPRSWLPHWLTRARPGDPDEALLDAVAQVRAALREAHPQVEGPADPMAESRFAVGALVLGVVGAWVVLVVVRRRVARADAHAEPWPGPGPLAALLGGMFGVVPAHWVYDRLLRDVAPEARMPSADIPADLGPQAEQTPPAEEHGSSEPSAEAPPYEEHNIEAGHGEDRLG
jgi:hypothetical protein